VHTTFACAVVGSAPACDVARLPFHFVSGSVAAAAAAAAAGATRVVRRNRDFESPSARTEHMRHPYLVEFNMWNSLACGWMRVAFEEVR
jgi:hypothetical protein